ncbi:uncharacterized protein LOC141611260 [Silene latifolia]|uniref:uncharacterized protein LOC141611260 n=1 Tax=Silene latifolia TaxID=37657 RepID=UPI003D77ACB6
MFHSILFSVALSCLVYSAIAVNNETDRLALLKFRAKINDPLGAMSSWNDTLHFCNWYGVTCGRMHQRVLELNLWSSQLSGSVSPYIGNLSFLRVLNLQLNKFSGTIPPEIGHLHRLQHLLLGNNSFGGEIPLNISRCSSLVELNVMNNMLGGVIPHELSFLSHLQSINLSKNNLVGNIPASLGNMSVLLLLYLAENSLVGRIPDSLGKLQNLTVLAVGTNRLSGTVPPSIFNCSSLVTLNLGENELEGHLPSDLGNTLPNLQFFSLSSNQLTGLIPPSISNSSHLEVLQLPSNGFQGEVPSLHKLDKIKHLNIGDNLLGMGQAADMNFVSSLANATVLQTFVISKNNFGGDFPRTICNFTRVSILDFGLNNISGQIPECFANLVNLQAFSTYRNLLSGVIPQEIGKLQKLVELDLSSNHLSGKIPSSFGNLTMLTTAQITENYLEGNIPVALANCGSLIVLDLSVNNLSGDIPSQLTGLSNFIVLDVYNNHLTGSLPEEIGRLNNLESLDVSINMLSGVIPSTLGSCIALQNLYMHGNFFQGTIPSALETLTGLRALELSRNNLSGTIPHFLAKLPLTMLDLSYNNLEGEVPSGGVFDNATGVSLFGNSRLCGGIPQLKLHNCSFDQTQIKRRSHRKRLLLEILCGFAAVILLVIFILAYMFWSKKRTMKTEVAANSKEFRNVSYQSILKATNGLSAVNLIGRGSFGAVYKGAIDQDGPVLAIKIFNLGNHYASKSFIAECKALRSIRHRNLIKVITVCSSVDYQGNDFKALVYEYMVNGSLDDWLHPTGEISGVRNEENAGGSLSFCQRLKIAVDVAFALEYLHHYCDPSVIHCDLKPSNVLLDDDMVAHVGDFGLAKLISEVISSSSANQSSFTGVRGTVGYAPPEYGMGNEVSACGDVYSFGILVLEMFTGKRPTDDIFREGTSQHEYVKAALSEQDIKIVDDALLHDMAVDNSNSQIVFQSVVSVLEIALSCSAELPQDRPDISTVAAKLLSIRNKL